MSPKVEENAAPLGMVAIPFEVVPFVRGLNPAIRALERVISDVAPTGVPILLIGESGIGKEVLALDVAPLTPDQREMAATPRPTRSIRLTSGNRNRHS